MTNRTNDPHVATQRGLTAWCIHHPIGVSMLTLAVVVLGLFSVSRLPVDLLPQIIQPEVRVRVFDPGVPASIIEDRITRQLEEQLAITEDAIAIESRSREGRSLVDLSFSYNKDINQALRDASTRLDRARRFLPDTIDAPIIYKLDPSQRPVAEFVISSELLDAVALRTWADDIFAKWFLNLPGVAAAEVGGGLVREIQILPDQGRLAALGLRLQDLVDTLRDNNVEVPAGRLDIANQLISSRTDARFHTVESISRLPITLQDGQQVLLQDLAEVVDGHDEEVLRIRLDGIPGIKVSIQKQPGANTVAVVDAVMQRLQQLQTQRVIPADIIIKKVGDQSVYISHALNNAGYATISGALLAMLVVYLFLGNLRRTLIIGSAIPIAIMFTFLLMDGSGLTLNIMTLGGLAVGVGMLVDNTIVMLENLYRHQLDGETGLDTSTRAAAEVQSAIIASTSTNLAAILPFLFISGLVGLLFRELIITVSSAIVASMFIALTLVPALAARVPLARPGKLRLWLDQGMDNLRQFMGSMTNRLLHSRILRLLLIGSMLAALIPAAQTFFSVKQDFLPKLDEGHIRINIKTDIGTALDITDSYVLQLEKIASSLPSVESIFTTSGGFVFGRSQYESQHHATLIVQLLPLSERKLSSHTWINQFNKRVEDNRLAGVRVRAYVSGVRGIPLSRGSDEISLRVQGPDPEILDEVAKQIITKLNGISDIRNIGSSSEEQRQEVAIEIDRERAATLGLSAEQIGEAIRLAVTGQVISDYFEGGRSFDIRIKLPKADVNRIDLLKSILIEHTGENRQPVYLADVARIRMIRAAPEILRENQQRFVEVSASLKQGVSEGEVEKQIQDSLANLELPEGYGVYDAGISKTMQEGRNMSVILLGLALFLVFAVMAIQYESLTNPLVILLGIPFTVIGVTIGLKFTGLNLSMPVWLGLIMLAGIVVNNAIVLLEYIELQRKQGMALNAAITEAVRLRLRPILMTTLTTIVGLAPLANAWGDGGEMLKPLAVTIISGLSFSLLVSLILIPVLYQLFHMSRRHNQAT